MAVFVANESGYEVDEPELAALAGHVLDVMGVDRLVELSVLLVDVESMSRLHEKWLGESGPTDVLAFPMDELSGQADFGAHPGDDAEGEPKLLGDVVVCPDVAAGQAAERGHPVTDEIWLLTTHGLLHLLGFDHAEPDEQREMYARQSELLRSWRSSRSR